MSIKIGIVGIIAATTMCSCSPGLSNDYTIYLSPQLSPEMTDEALTGLHEWEDKIPDLRLNIVFGYGEACDHCVLVQPESVDWLRSYSSHCAHDNCVGYTEWNAETDSYVVYLGTLDDSHTQQRRDMIAHEFGHSFGLRHPDAESPSQPDTAGVQIMCPGACSTNHVTCADAQQYYTIRGKVQPICE